MTALSVLDIYTHGHDVDMDRIRVTHTPSVSIK